MPGYKPLPTSVIGPAAEQVRTSESSRKDGDPKEAIAVLEEALAIAERQQGSLPGWLCGRLAALYRTVGRYDDEVHLLERYRETQHSDEARTRYDARLSKARTIAERKRRPESGALASVREAMARPRSRRSAPHTRIAEVLPRFSRDLFERVQNALAAREDALSAELLDRVIVEIQEEAARQGAPLEELVSLLVSARDALLARAEGEDDVRRTHARYGDALVQLLSAAYTEKAS